MISLQVAEKLYLNKRNFSVSNECIRYDPVTQFIRQCHNLVNHLNTPAFEEISRAYIPHVLHLRNAVVHALQPFDSNSLDLDRLFARFSNDLCQVTEFPEYIEALYNNLTFILQNPLNPKLNWVQKTLEDLEGEKSVGVIAPSYHICTDSWIQEWTSILDSIYENNNLIRTERDIRNSTWDILIMPFGGKRLSFLNHIYRGYHSGKLYVLYYKGEAKAECQNPEPIKLHGQKVSNTLPDPETNISLRDISDEEELLERMFWNRHRETAKSKLIDEGDEDYFVPARLVLLGGNRLVYLSTEKSELVGSLDDAEGIADSFCRKRVSQLREGEYIVLRTGTNYDLVKTIADEKMERDNVKASVTLGWKDMLKKALNKTGVQKFEEYLRQNGLEVPCPNYVKAWTGEAILRPGSEERYFILLNTIRQCGVWESNDTVEELASKRWKEMLKIINYRRQAGFDIRKILLDKLGNILSEATEIGDELVVNLDDRFPGASISLFRIVDIDKKDENVPASRIDKLIEIETES